MFFYLLEFRLYFIFIFTCLCSFLINKPNEMQTDLIDMLVFEFLIRTEYAHSKEYFFLVKVEQY